MPCWLDDERSFSRQPDVSVIEVFADVVCPFTHAGFRRLVAERQVRGRDDVVLKVRSWPLEMVNGQPLDPQVVAEEVRALQASVAPDLFTGFDPTRWPDSSVPALSLAAAALDVGVEEGEAVALALRTALFEDGLDVADSVLLDEIASAHGVVLGDPEVGRSRVLADWREGQERGVVGSPHFFVGDADMFCPTLKISHAHGRFDVELATASFTDFMDRCFA
jgi:predicted DsbA family dithiol-disulfide isomerase